MKKEKKNCDTQKEQMLLGKLKEECQGNFDGEVEAK